MLPEKLNLRYQLQLLNFDALSPSEVDLDIVRFVLRFSCGYYVVSSVFFSVMTRLAYDTCLEYIIRILIRTLLSCTTYFLV